MDFQIKKDKNQNYLETSLSDYALITNPLLNKGMAFSSEEREMFRLFGLIPPHQSTLQEQALRSYQAFKNKPSDLDKYIYLRDLQDSNETLFFYLVTQHINEILPIVYTPTVGLGCQRFSHVYRRPRGIFLSYPDKRHIEYILANPRFNGVEAIVVSDGERILGLGDQGAGGMGIPIGKLSLYTACAGIHPSATLPILLDTGTNNQDLISDPLYIGWRHERIRGQEYDDFIDTFVQAVNKRFPKVLLQWEDFAQQNANRILDRYRNELCTFNDDIQGTAAVATGTLLAAIDITRVPLHDQLIVVVGAGSAGCGISKLIMSAMMEEGLTEQEARARFFLIDRNGLLLEGMPDLLPFQQPFAQSRDIIFNWQGDKTSGITLKMVMENIRPTVLLGVSGQPGIFNEEIVRKMAKNVERPIIFPLSNPTSLSEAVPQDLLKWTDGRAIIGTGSPFGEILRNGKSFRIDQTNNSYIFPGLGLGLIATKAQKVTDNMFMAAAKALAACSPAKTNPEGNLLPDVTQIREVSFQVALAVAKEVQAAHLENVSIHEDLETFIRKKMWQPAYLPYRKMNL